MPGSNACTGDGRQKEVRAGAEGRSRALNVTAECEHNTKEFTCAQLEPELRCCLGKSVAVREDDHTFQKRRKGA